MTDHITPEADGGPGIAHADSARGGTQHEEVLLDHHIEELLGALGGPGLRGKPGSEDGV